MIKIFINDLYIILYFLEVQKLSFFSLVFVSINLIKVLQQMQSILSKQHVLIIQCKIKEQCWKIKWQRKSIWILLNLWTIAVCQVDPLFKVMSAAFDEGGSSGLLLNNLRCFDDRQDLVLDSSSDVAQVDYSIDISQRKPLEMSEIKGRLLFRNDVWCHCKSFFYVDVHYFICYCT